MKINLISITISLYILFLSLNIKAADVLTLRQLKDEVLNKNIDIQTQYEKYYQSQQSVKLKLGEFLPSLDIQLLYLNSTLSLLYSLVPTPSRWFEYESSKELEIAQMYVTESIKLNILNELTITFLNIKHQQALRESLAIEKNVLLELYHYAQNRERIGIGDPSETYAAKRELLQHQQKIFAIDSVISVAKEGLLLAIGRNPNEDIILDELDQFTFEPPKSIEKAIDLALLNSPELKSNMFLAEGARYMAKSAKWSFISFSGIGFGYPSSVKIEQSKVSEFEYKDKKISHEIKSQVANAYHKIKSIKERYDIQNHLLNLSQNALEKYEDLYLGGLCSLYEYTEFKQMFYKEQRNLTTLKYQESILLAQIARLLGVESQSYSADEVSQEDIDLSVDIKQRSFGRKYVMVDIDVSDDLKSQIVSVQYHGDIFSRRIINKRGNLSAFRKIKVSGKKLIKATVLLFNGKKIVIDKEVHI